MEWKENKGVQLYQKQRQIQNQAKRLRVEKEKDLNLLREYMVWELERRLALRENRNSTPLSVKNVVDISPLYLPSTPIMQLSDISALNTLNLSLNSQRTFLTKKLKTLKPLCPFSRTPINLES